METPPLLKGYLYDSTRVCRCPRFHACTISKKCQNYDPNQLDCSLCETAVDPPIDLGGHLPEGEFYPDIQDAIKTVQEALNKPLAHPDQEAQKINGPEITNQYNKTRKSIEMLKRFQGKGVLKMTEEWEDVNVDPEIAKLFGRVD